MRTLCYQITLSFNNYYTVCYSGSVPTFAAVINAFCWTLNEGMEEKQVYTNKILKKYIRQRLVNVSLAQNYIRMMDNDFFPSKICMQI